MPKAKTEKSAVKEQEGQRQAKFMVYRYGERKVVASLPLSYGSALSTARKLFKLTRIKKTPAFHTTLPGAHDECEIAEEVFSALVDMLPYLRVSFLDDESSCESDCELSKPPAVQPMRLSLPRSAPPVPASTGRIISLNLNFHNQILVVKAQLSTSCLKLMQAAAHRLGKEADQLRFFAYGRQLYPRDALSNYDLCDGDEIVVFVEQRGGKPVIYLYPPTAQDVSVGLSLIPQWSFSALYPSPSIERTGFGDGKVGQHTCWNVRARPDGLLTDKATGADVTYLFWEAETNSGLPDSPPSSPLAGDHVEVFDPANAHVSPQESVLLPTSTVPVYLDKALTALGLHTEARTDFITYWLPSILKHKNIALRFLPQKAYERAAPLDINPLPDVITRIFMLFRGVADDDAAELQWEGARMKATAPVESWFDVVGVDANAKDEKLFRVLEWGGMEVY